MDHNDHVELIRRGISGPGGVWADFGSGSGAFTLALAELIGPDGEIISVDKNKSAIQMQVREMHTKYPNVKLRNILADFTKPLDLPLLDGLLVANALHFLKKKDGVIQLLSSYLRPGGRFVVVEYNTDKGNPWVPHPFSFTRWRNITAKNGHMNCELLNAVPSSFLGEIYAAVSFVPGNT
jgi:ubiquinone/menaquinone biosynthesis C-methylase UbiE